MCCFILNVYGYAVFVPNEQEEEKKLCHILFSITWRSFLSVAFYQYSPSDISLTYYLLHFSGSVSFCWSSFVYVSSQLNCEREQTQYFPVNRLSLLDFINSRFMANNIIQFWSWMKHNWASRWNSVGQMNENAVHRHTFISRNILMAVFREIWSTALGTWSRKLRYQHTQYLACARRNSINKYSNLYTHSYTILFIE